MRINETKNYFFLRNEVVETVDTLMVIGGVLKEEFENYYLGIYLGKYVSFLLYLLPLFLEEIYLS